VKPKSEAKADELWVHQQAWFNLGEFDKKTDTTYTLHNPGHGAYILAIEGSVNVEGEELNDRDAIGIWDTDSIGINASENSKVLLIEVPMN